MAPQEVSMPMSMISAQWMLLHLNHGTYGEQLKDTLFSVENQNEMWMIHTTTRTNRNPRYNSHFSGYGLGWGLTDIKGNMEVSHTGGLPGMLSRTVMIPDLNLGIVVLTNTEPGGAGLFSGVSRTLVDSYLGLNDYGWVKRYVAYFKESKGEAEEVVHKVWETVAANKKTKIDKNTYIGTMRMFGSAKSKYSIRTEPYG